MPENLVLTGSAAVGGTGNGLANRLTGNAAANVLNGSTGNDTLIGGGAKDKLTGGTGNDTFQFASLAKGGDAIADFRNASGNNDAFRIRHFIQVNEPSGLIVGQQRVLKGRHRPSRPSSLGDLNEAYSATPAGQDPTQKVNKMRSFLRSFNRRDLTQFVVFFVFLLVALLFMDRSNIFGTIMIVFICSLVMTAIGKWLEGRGL